MPAEPFLEVISPGGGLTFQDAGRPGFGRWGVPPGGWMDPHPARWANRLLGNPDQAPVLELALQGVVLRVLRPGWLALCGADMNASLPLWRATRVPAETVLRFPENRSGVWAYLAAPGGWVAPEVMGSVSVAARCGLGSPLKGGEMLFAAGAPDASFETAVAGRTLRRDERRDYAAVVRLRAWHGPQWRQFSHPARAAFHTYTWRVSARIDRNGYRLHGPDLAAPGGMMTGEGVLPGSVQVPPDGQPIVTMVDGPTVGGYPKIAVLDRFQLARLAQCRPGQKVRFHLHE